MTSFDLRYEGRTGLEMGLGVGQEAMTGWPYTDFATGWYVIGYSSELAPGEVKAARWFGEDLVVFRTETGRLSVLGAYCPHMGAHLGRPGQFGGGVCGETLRCPWHGWRWDTEGHNVEIPYRPEQPVKAEVGRKEVREIDGLIMMWFDHADRAPIWEWPGLPYLGDKADYYPIDTTVDGPYLAKPQFPLENSADPHHFVHVHGAGLDAEFNDFIVDGPLAQNTMTLVFGAGREKTWFTPDGPIEGHVDSILWAANLGIARFRIGDMVCVHLSALTPVDDDHHIFFSTVTATREPGDTGDVPTGRSGRFMKEQHWQIRNDFHIWQDMRYRVKPIFTGQAERTRYAFIRRHLDQFYPNPVYGGPNGNGAMVPAPGDRNGVPK